jgi:hypothetical protein
LREENKDLRQKYAQLQRVRISSLKNLLHILQQTTAQDDEKEEVKHIEREVDRLRKIYDELKVKSIRFKKELDIMKDSIKDLELDSQRPHMV